MKSQLKPIFYLATGVVLALIFGEIKMKDAPENEEETEDVSTPAEKASDEFGAASRSRQRELALRNELAGMTALVVKAGTAFFDQAKWDAKMEELREARADLVRRGENPLGPSGGEMLLMQGNTISQIPPFNKEEAEKWRAAHPAEEQKAQEVIAQEKKRKEESDAKRAAEEEAQVQKEVDQGIED